MVVMPDLFDGDPAPNTSALAEEQQPPVDSSSSGAGSILDSFKLKAAETAKSFLIDMWLARHTEGKVLPLLHRVLDACRDEFADAVAAGEGVYAAGYCFGGRYVLLLAAERPVPAPATSATRGLVLPWSAKSSNNNNNDNSNSSSSGGSNDEEANKPKTTGPFIKTGVLAHATLVSTEDFVGLKAPVSVVCVENDPLFPDDVRMAGEDYMSRNNVEHEVQVYPGVPHGMSLPPSLFFSCTFLSEQRLTNEVGFAVVGEYADENIRSAQVTAYEQMLKWLKEH